MRYFWVQFKHRPSKPIVALYDKGKLFITVGYYDKALSPSNNYIIQQYDMEDYEIIGPVLLEDAERRSQEQEAEAIAAYERGEGMFLDELIEKIRKT